MGKRSVSVVVLLLTSSCILLAGPVTGHGDDGGALPPMDSGRAFNATETMGFTWDPPTIDGTLSSGEWDDAAVYDIGRSNNIVKLYLMRDEDTIYMAIDAISDVTNDKKDPPTGYLTANDIDYLLLTIDGENDGLITYEDPDPYDAVPGEMPPTRPPPGNCVDRGAATSGGDHRIAGWWNKADGNSIMWVSATGVGPNQGTEEPFDYINPGFDGHRTYEYSIPYNGTGDELLRQPKDRIGVSIRVYDNKGGASPSLIGAMPASASGTGPPFQVLQLNARPEAVLEALNGPVFYVGEVILLDGGGSSDPDDPKEFLRYYWDKDYDGVNFDINAGTAVSYTIMTYDEPGSHNFALMVDDDYGGYDIDNVSFEVVNIPSPPVLTDLSPSQDMTINESESITFTVEFDDPNFGDGENIHVEWLLDNFVVQDMYSMAASHDSYTFETGYSGMHGAGMHIVELRVNDTYNPKGNLEDPPYSLVHRWNITVLDVNRPPVISDYGPADSRYVVTDEETMVEFWINVSDPDGPEPVVRWLLDGVIQQTTNDSLFRYLEAPDYNASGDHEVQVIAEDAASTSLGTSIGWSVSVLDVNRPPRIISYEPGTKSVFMYEGQEMVFTVDVVDLDGDMLTYEWSLDGDLEKEGDDANYTFLATTISDRVEDHRVSVNVTDGKDTVEQRWTVFVEDVDNPPHLVVLSPKEGEHFQLSDMILFDCSGTSDPDVGDRLYFEWDLNDGDVQTGSSVLHRYSDPGRYMVKLKVTSEHDGVPTVVEWSVNITVDAAKVRLVEVSTDRDSLKAREQVTLSFTLTNDGSLKATDILLSVHLGATFLEQVKVDQIDAGSSRMVERTYTIAKEGTYIFKVSLDSGDENTLFYSKSLDSREIKVTAAGGGGGGPSAGTTVSKGSFLLPVVALLAIMGPAYIVLRNLRHEERWLEERERQYLRKGQITRSMMEEKGPPRTR